MNNSINPRDLQSSLWKLLSIHKYFVPTFESFTTLFSPSLFVFPLQLLPSSLSQTPCPVLSLWATRGQTWPLLSSFCQSVLYSYSPASLSPSPLAHTGPPGLPVSPLPPCGLGGGAGGPGCGPPTYSSWLSWERSGTSILPWCIHSHRSVRRKGFRVSKRLCRKNPFFDLNKSHDIHHSSYCSFFI